MSVGRRKRFRRELRVRVLLAALPLLRVLPLRAGAALGWLAWYLVPRQWRLAQAHLALAFPERSEGERARIGRASFVNLGLAALEAARADRLDIRKTVELGPDAERVLRAVQAKGNGVVLVTGHIGAWELFARRVAALGFPCGTVAKEAHDPRLTALLQRSREAAGVRVFWRGDPMSARQILRFLRAGGMLGFLIDQDPKLIGARLRALGADAELRRRLGAAARESSLRFTAEQMVAEHHDLYRRIAGETAAR